MKQKLTEFKGQLDSYTMIIDFNVLLSIQDRTIRHKINKKMEEMNNTIDQLNISDIYKTLYPKTAKCIFFWSAYSSEVHTEHPPG